MKGLTASKLYVAKRCAAAFALEHVDVRTDNAAEGVDRHADYERRIQAGDIPEALAERWPGVEFRAEIAFAYAPGTGIGRELGAVMNRDYSSAQPDEICGTADAVGLGNGKLVIVDWKSYREVERASVNAQLHIAALSLCRAYGLDAADVAIHYEARPMDVASLDVFDLEAFSDELRIIVERVHRAREMLSAGGSHGFNEGEHCRFCPALLACPAKRQLAAVAETRIAQHEAGKLLFSLDNDDEAARAYEFAERLGHLLSQLRGALIMRAKERPIPLRTPGKMYGTVVSQGNETIDGDVAYAVIREKHGQGIADAAVVRSATKKRIKDALMFAGVSNKAAAEREILDEVRKRGGSSRETKERVEEYSTPPQLVAVSK